MADSTQSWFGRAASRVGRAITFSTARNKRLENVGIQRVAFPAADEKTTALISSRDAFEAQVTAGAGPMLDRHSTYPATSLDPEKIESVMREATLGIVYRYADLCEQIRQRDAHLRSVDHGRRAAVANKPFLVLPKDDTPLAGAVANYLRAVVDDIDGFSSSIYSVLTSNCDGYGAGELVYQPGARRFPGIDGKAVMVRGLFPRRIPWVHGKHFRFQQDNRDVPLLDLGAGRYTDLVPGKFLYHRCMGDGISTMRGYIRSVVWLHFLKHASLRDWGIFLHLYGIPQLYGALDKDLWSDAANRALLEKALVAYGTGESAPILPTGMEIKVTPGPTPSAVEAHKALCGYCDSSISKAVQGETLTTEMGGTGSYNASETHAQTKHDVIQGDAVTMAEDIRSDVFRPAIEINIDALALALHTPPDEIRAVVSRCAFETDRETSPEARMRIMLGYAKAGVRISLSQIREENNFRAPSSAADTLPGETVTVPKDGAVVGAVEAAQGLTNPAPDEEQGSGERPASPSLDGGNRQADEQPAEARRLAVAMAAGLAAAQAMAAWEESKHPRAGNGKFGPGSGGSGGGGSGAPSGGESTSEAPPASERAAKPRQPRPFRLKSPRAPKPKQPKDPNAPKPAPREYHRDHLGRFRTKPAPGSEQAWLPAKLPTVEKAGIAKPDPTKVPGAPSKLGEKSGTWKVRITTDPENGYKGRSYAMHSMNSGVAEFMAAPASPPPGVDSVHTGPWTNADVFAAVIGRSDEKLWDDLNEHLDLKGSKRIKNAVDAVKACMAIAVGTRSKRDWRDFNMEALQAAHPSLSVLSLPPWLHEAESEKATAAYIREQAEEHAERLAAWMPGKDSHKQLDDSEMPDYGGHEEYQTYDHHGNIDDVPF